MTACMTFAMLTTNGITNSPLQEKKSHLNERWEKKYSLFVIFCTALLALLMSQAG